jgi:hypothetical protein
MTVSPRSLVLACALVLTAAAPVMAQQQPVGDKKKALELYDRAKVQYDLGHWKQAIDLWVQAYETFNAPEFLFNIGQAYRQDGNCDRALFFYRRYLASKPAAKNRGEVEGFMKELEGKCKPSPESTGPDGPGPTGPQPDKNPTGAQIDGGADTGDTGDTADGADDGGEDLEEDAEIEGGVETTGDQPRYFAIRVYGGPSFPSLGDLEVGTLASFAIGGGHAFYFGKLAIEPGVLATYTPIPWETTEPMASGTAAMTGFLGNIGASYSFLPRLSGRAEVGAGAVIFSGLGEPGNPFLEEGTELTGGKAIALFNARFALGAEYAVTKNFIVHALPVVLSYSPSSPLRNDIDQVTQFQILLGAGYQM